MELVELKCRNCGGALDGSDVSVELRVVRCRYCDAIYALQARPPSTAGETTPPVRPRVGMPRGFSVRTHGTELEITRRWFRPLYVFMIFVTIFWNVFLLFWHGLALATGAWFLSLFALLHTGVGVFLVYSTLAGLLNTTTVSVDRSRIRVAHFPLPWTGGLALDARNLVQLYARESKKGGQPNARHSFALYALDKGGNAHCILKSLDTIEQAVFIEQQIESHLGIEDRPVRGEA